MSDVTFAYLINAVYFALGGVGWHFTYARPELKKARKREAIAFARMTKFGEELVQIKRNIEETNDAEIEGE